MTSNAQAPNPGNDARLPFCGSKRRIAMYVAIAIATCAIVAAIAATTAVFLLRDAESNALAAASQSPPSTCDSVQCQQVSRLLQDSMSHDVNPCDDFYAYVCNGWKAVQSKYSTVFNVHEANLTYAVLDTLEHTHVQDTGQSTFEKAAGLYQTCLGSFSGTEEAENAPKVISTFLNEKQVAFKMTYTIDSAAFFLELAFGYGVPTLVEMDVQNIPALQGRLAVVVSLRETLGRRFSGTKEQIYEHLASVGGRKSLELATVASTIHEVNEVITNAAQIALSNHMKEDGDILLYMLERFEKVATEKFTGHWNKKMRAFSNHILPGQHYLAIKGRHVTKFLNTVFRSINSHSLGLWLGYEASLYLKQLVERGVVDDARKEVLLPKWRKRCLKLTSEVMHFATYSSYFYQVIPPQETGVGQSIVNSIVEAITRRIGESTWLDDSSKQSALRKISNMRTNVGYPKKASNTETLDEYYKIYPDMKPPFLQSWLHASRAYAQRNIERLREPDQVDLNRDMSFVNAFYQPLLNQVVVPVALLIPPFCGVIPAVDYGAVGHLAAHEMMHAFDVYSSHLDEYGRKRDLWTHKVREEYGKRVQCLRESIRDPGTPKVQMEPDDNIDSEMLADFIGVSGLYDAYKAQPAALLEGFEDIGSDQVFFLSFCLKWCSNVIPTSRYPEFQERCNGPLRNTEQFALAFNCSSGTHMNAQNKCSFW